MAVFFPFLEQKIPYFYFALDPANYVANPASVNYFTSQGLSLLLIIFLKFQLQLAYNTTLVSNVQRSD